MTWMELVSSDVIDWLLGPESPSVRFWALQQLEERRADHKDVKEAQEAIMTTPCIKAILKAQMDEGNWGRYSDMYEPKYVATTHNLLLLAELGAKRTNKIEAAIEHLYQFQRDSGHFLTSIPKTDRGRASTVFDGCCLDGNILFYLIHFGFLDDPRTEKLIDFQIEYHSEDKGGWKCRAFPIDRNKVFPENCYMGAVKLLRGLAQIPRERRSSELDIIIDQEIEIILENEIFRYLKNQDGSRKEKAGWKRFGFPLFYQSDILEVLDVLTKFGVKDSRMQEAVDYVISCQGDDDRWLLKNTFNGKMLCEIDEKNKPSKWITLRAARVLKRFLG
ncbi:MAG: hypothetical protein ACFFFO_02160 [Candidatus Thorarchaeota archaeon]